MMLCVAPLPSTCISRIALDEPSGKLDVPQHCEGLMCSGETCDSLKDLLNMVYSKRLCDAQLLLCMVSDCIGELETGDHLFFKAAAASIVLASKYKSFQAVSQLVHSGVARLNNNAATMYTFERFLRKTLEAVVATDPGSSLASYWGAYAALVAAIGARRAAKLDEALECIEEATSKARRLSKTKEFRKDGGAAVLGLALDEDGECTDHFQVLMRKIIFEKNNIIKDHFRNALLASSSSSELQWEQHAATVRASLNALL